MNCMSQVSPSQPMLIIATCHCGPAELPPLFTSFFGGGSAGKQSGAAQVITLDADLPAMEARPPQAGFEHLLQERRNTAATRATREEKQSAAGRENAASAGPPAGTFKPVLNAAQKDQCCHILAQVCHGFLPDFLVQQHQVHELPMGMLEVWCALVSQRRSRMGSNGVATLSGRAGCSGQ